MKVSKYGIPHIKDGKHLKAGPGSAVNVLSVAAFAIAAFDLARDNKVEFSSPIEATNKHDLQHQLSGVSLADNQVLVGFRVRGDLRGNGIPPLADAFPGGKCDNDMLERVTYRALLKQAAGVLSLDDLQQADDSAELHALPGLVNLSAHDDAFLAFVRTELSQ